ncbi:hypothetical protein KA541_004697 [Salmonella enterica subsp. enterica serovar Rubislaw]|nr:hypothetical protein [Salmonella enterica subsp. enterica serovar Rubislaw]
MNSFFERYKPVFEIVCRILGNGWRVNLLDDCQYRIKLTSPQFKNYSIHIRMEKGRLVIIGSVDSRSWRSPYHTCTVSPERNPVEIAADIEKKILTDALVRLENWHGTLTGFKVENGLDGNVSERGDGYEMVIRGLSVDQLIKVAGFIKKL